MGKLTGVQLRMLKSVASGEVRRSFDVYGGYCWQEGASYTRWKKSEHDAPAPLVALIGLQMVAVGETTRPFSGSQVTSYVITPAGRAALEQTP